MDKLPPTCYAINPGDEFQVTRLRRGVIGYWHVRKFKTTKEAQEFANARNREAGITEAQAEAMLNGSMFGFEVPGADPDNCGGATNG